MGIGTKIRQIRDLKGLNQENMANELGISVTGYGKIERNEVSVNYERLKQISTVLGVKVEHLIGFDNNLALNNFNNTVDVNRESNFNPRLTATSRFNPIQFKVTK